MAREWSINWFQVVNEIHMREDFVEFDILTCIASSSTWPRNWSNFSIYLNFVGRLKIKLLNLPQLGLETDPEFLWSLLRVEMCVCLGNGFGFRVEQNQIVCLGNGFGFRVEQNQIIWSRENITFCLWWELKKVYGLLDKLYHFPGAVALSL